MLHATTFARQFFPGENAVGKRIQPGLSTWENEDSKMREIVGVVADIRNRALNTEPKPVYYLPHSQVPFNEVTMVAKTSNDPHALIASATREAQAMDSELPVFNIKTMDEIAAESVARQRFSMMLLAIFAAVALVLAAVGIYGVMSYSVTQRRNEIGIRMALGAQRRDVLKLTVGQGLKLVLVGVAVGLVGAFVLTRLMVSLLFGVGATDPATFIAISVILVGVALFASYIPARRATRVDPLVALRYQ